MGNIVILKDYKVIKESGLHHRIVCMTGPKRGEVYYIKGKRVLLGRSKEADITIQDAQSSREHAELSKVGTQYIITDLKSNNGVIINGRKIKQSPLKTRDRIIVGKTVYKYEILNVEESPNTPSQIIRSERESRESIIFQNKNKNKNKISVILALLVIGGFLSLQEDPAPKKKKLKERASISVISSRKIQSKKSSKKDKEIEKRLDIVMHKGIRELREKNHYRAISEFNLALIIDPKNPRALAYRRSAKDLHDKEIEAYFNQATRNFESFNYQRVVKSYCQIIKLLEDFPEDERRKSAEENLIKLVDKHGVDKDAVNCN